MGRLINNILLELSSRVGIIDFKKDEHITELGYVLDELGMDNIKLQLIQNIREASQSKALTKQAKAQIQSKGLVHLGYGYYGKNDKVSHKKNPETGELEPASQQEYERQNDKEQVNAGNKQRTTQQQTQSNQGFQNQPAPGNLIGDPSEWMHDPEVKQRMAKTSDKPKLSKEEQLTRKDNKKVDLYLELTKRKARNIANKKGKQGVGAGTFESRAGEALVHKGIRLFKQGKSIDAIKKSLSDVVNSKDHILNSTSGKKWVDAATATLKQIDNHIGVKNIADVVWDTNEGKESIGISKSYETPADIFVKTKDGKNIGISLKKDGLVFINNGGWDKQSKIILNKMKSSISKEDFDNFSDAISIEKYNQDLTEITNSIYNDLGHDELQTAVVSILGKSKKWKDKTFFGKEGSKQLDALNNTSMLMNSLKAGNLTVTQTIALSKVLKETHPESYDKMRSADLGLTDRMFDMMNQSRGIRTAMNKYIIDSIHLMDTLGLNESMKRNGMDQFLTIYGIGDTGASLDEHSLKTLFGSRFSDTLAKVRNGDMKKSDLMDVITESIEIDHTSGEILFKHENNNKYPLFTIQARTRGIGTAPKMEILQTPFMAHALTQGTFNTDEWDSDSFQRFKKFIK